MTHTKPFQWYLQGGLFSLMVDKSNSNGSDKATMMFNTFLVITPRPFHTRTLQKMSVTESFHILESPIVLEKSWNVPHSGGSFCFMHHKKEIPKSLAPTVQRCDEIISCTFPAGLSHVLKMQEMKTYLHVYLLLYMFYSFWSIKKFLKPKMMELNHLIVSSAHLLLVKENQQLTTNALKLWSSSLSSLWKENCSTSVFVFMNFMDVLKYRCVICCNCLSTFILSI